MRLEGPSSRAEHLPALSQEQAGPTPTDLTRIREEGAQHIAASAAAELSERSERAECAVSSVNTSVYSSYTSSSETT